tara:strand:- start:366 stop:812 length:447 start_codon:yes stop_codon:yes gene_type:complete
MIRFNRVVSVPVLAVTVLALGVSALLAETDYLALEEIDRIRKGQRTLRDPIADTITIDEKYPVVGPDASTVLLLLKGTCTNAQTVAFAETFGATPEVFLQWTDDVPASVTNGTVRPVGVTTSNFVVDAQFTTSGPMTNLSYFAVGTRP